jgi:hypothetical protein
MRHRTAISLVALICACLGVAAQQAPPPQARPGQPGAVDPRSNAVNAKGTSVIRGRVVAADSGRPLRGALVVATCDAVRRSAYTDQDGRFGWSDLPAGAYRVNVGGLAGYVPLEYGADLDSTTGTAIQLTEGETFDKADIRLPRGGVVSGRVVDEAGEPIDGVGVQAYAVDYVAGVERLRSAETASSRSKPTNDAGRYRIFGLPPGEYYIAASPGPFGTPSATRDLSSGYAITYYPGTPVAAEAQRVTVVTAREVSNVDFGLVPSKAFAVSGTAVDGAGAPLPAASLWLMPAGNPAVTIRASAMTAGDGSFTFSNIPAGKYLLQSIPMPGVRWSFLSAAVTVVGDTRALVVQAKAPCGASGEVIFEGGTPPPSTSGVRIAAWPVDPIRSPLLGADLVTSPKDDWTFELTNLWGSRLVVANLPPGWGLKAVKLDGVDATDKPIDFERERAAHLQVVLTNAITGLTGVVTDDGRPAQTVTVLAFAADSTRWSYASRFLMGTTTDENGRYTMSALPPAEYRVIAIPRARPGWQRASFLDPLVRDSSRVVLHDGERAALDLKVVKPR